MTDFNPRPYRMTSLASASATQRPINTSLVVGLVSAISLLIFGAFSGGTPLRFINPEGFLLVIGGTFAATLIQFSLRDVRLAVEAGRSSLAQNLTSPGERMQFLLSMSRRVKERGILVLEEEASGVDDDFLRLGLSLVVDGQGVDDMHRILSTEMRFSTEQAWRSVHVWETAGNFAPAMGLIGTLIGLIQMMGSLHDAAAVGPAMGMALIATLYGAVAANLFFFPMAGKLRLSAQEREQCKKITLEGLISIARLENPIMLEQRLQSFACA